jgi:hypothetical protein
MTTHDLFRDVNENKELMDKLGSKFNDLTFDAREIMDLSQNPAMLGLLLFKLAEERKKTNELLEKIYQKYDDIMLLLKTPQSMEAPLEEKTPKTIDILPEPDQKIMELAQISGRTTAEEVTKALGYKGKNAACQRLNKLHKDGYLKKVRSGKSVLYLPSPL